MTLDGPGHVFPEVLKESQHPMPVEDAHIGIVDTSEERQKNIPSGLQHSSMSVSDSTLRHVTHE